MIDRNSISKGTCFARWYIFPKVLAVLLHLSVLTEVLKDDSNLSEYKQNQVFWHCINSVRTENIIFVT